MNVKLEGSRAEARLRNQLANWGFWTHLLEDNKNGQPFDIIAIKNGKIFAMDSKTSVSNRFNCSRIEDNQYSSLALIAKEGAYTGFAIHYQDLIYFLDYETLKEGTKSYEIEKLPRLEEYIRKCLFH